MQAKFNDDKHRRSSNNKISSQKNWQVMLMLLIVEFMNDEVEMGSGAMIYIQSFIKTDWGIRK
jgi:hypothetical protein